MQNELITEKVEKSDKLNPGESNTARIEDTIVQLVFGGILWNKVIPPLSSVLLGYSFFPLPNTHR